MKNPSTDCLIKRAEEQEVEAEKFGFSWTSFGQLMEQVQSECREIQEAWENKNTPHLQEEIGDLIQAAIGLAIFCQFDPRETLLKSIEKFQLRYDVVVELAKKDGHSHLQNQPFEVLMHYWDLAKAQTKSKAQE